MKKLILLALIVSFNASAQQYKTGIGVKGFNSGYFGYHGYYGRGALNVKHFFGGASAIEGSIGGGSNHLWFQGMYEKNSDLGKGLEWYWGLGGDIGFWDRKYYKDHPVWGDSYHERYSWGGFDGVVGLEYTFSEIPINLALDLGPTIRLWPNVGFGWLGGFALRFAIK